MAERDGDGGTVSAELKGDEHGGKRVLMWLTVLGGAVEASWAAWAMLVWVGWDSERSGGVKNMLLRGSEGRGSIEAGRASRFWEMMRAVLVVPKGSAVVAEVEEDCSKSL